MRNFSRVARTTALLGLLCAGQAQAYIDPSTGSYVLQILIAGFLGALFAIKMFWLRIVTFLRGLRSKNHETPDN